MKKIITHIKRIANVYADLLDAINRLKFLLKPGIYKIKLSSLSKKRVLLFPRHLIVIKKHENTIDCKGINVIEVVYCNKILVFLNDLAISFYGEDKTTNIDKYIKAINYHKTKFYYISVDGNFTITNKVIGDTNYNKTRMNIVAFETLKCAINSVDITKPDNCILNDAKYPNIRYSVQHGDLGWGNILWTDDFHYSVIDFDSIGIYPTFYDFFVLTVFSKGVIKRYYNGMFDREIHDYMLKHSICVPIESFKDECLAAYVITDYKRKKVDTLIRKDVPNNYTLTREAIAFAELSRRSMG